MSERSPGARDLDTLVERAARLTAAEGFGRRVQTRLDEGAAWRTPGPRSAGLALAGTAALVVVALLVWMPWREQRTLPADVASSALSTADIDRTDPPRPAGSMPPVALRAAEQPRSPRVAGRAVTDGRRRATQAADIAAATVGGEAGADQGRDVEAWRRLRPAPIHVAPIEVASLADHQDLAVDPIHVVPIEIDRLASPAPIGQTSTTPAPPQAQPAARPVACSP